MDFHTLTRRELQALCKMNKIPANMTNVAMAEALKALEFVEGIEGIEEIMKPSESETANLSVESPEKSDILSCTGRRTANRKTANKESEISQTTTARRTRQSTRRLPPRNLDEAMETPAAPTTRRRAAAVSVHSNMEILLKECVDKERDGEQILNEKKTPGGAMLTSRRREVKEKSSVRPVYSSRRSTRLAAKYEDESSKQDSETDERDLEILEVNSKLCSLHLGGAAADSSASNGNENQNVVSEEQKVEMHQSSEEYANGLIENYGLSVGKESNDVEVDLQQGDDDIKLKSQEVVGDNLALSKPSDDKDKSEVTNTDKVPDENLSVPNTNETSRCEVEEDDGEDKVDEICSCAVKDVDVMPKIQEEVVFGDNTVDEMIQVYKQLDAEVVVVPKQLDVEGAHDGEIDTKEISDADLQCKGQEIVGDADEEQSMNTSECKGQEIVDDDDTALPMQNDEEQSMNVDAETHPASKETVDDEISEGVNVDAGNVVQEYASKEMVDSEQLQDAARVVQEYESKEMVDDAPVLLPQAHAQQSIVSDDKENSGIELVLKGNAGMQKQKPFEDSSIRQLRKMIKEKLQITDKSTRQALQQV